MKYEKAISILQDAPIAFAERENWTAFLRTAAKFYRYSITDQIMIHAQRPDATACATFHTWSDRMNCRIRSGSKGIALPRKNGRLTYVFDVSDVIPRRDGRVPTAWKMTYENQPAAMEEAERAFGETDHSLPFFMRIMELTEAISDRYMEQFFHDSRYINGPDAEKMDNIRQTIEHSAAYMILARCGMEQEELDDIFIFRSLPDVADYKTMTLICQAVSGISGEILNVFGRSIQAREAELSQKDEEVLAKENNQHYNALKYKSDEENLKNE